jgi:hypothetical protein
VRGRRFVSRHGPRHAALCLHDGGLVRSLTVASQRSVCARFVLLCLHCLQCLLGLGHLVRKPLQLADAAVDGVLKRMQRHVRGRAVCERENTVKPLANKKGGWGVSERERVRWWVRVCVCVCVPVCLCL